MDNIVDIKKLPTETEEQFLWKIGQLVDSGELESWESVNQTVNKEILGDDETSYRTESAWRKRYQAAKKFYDNCFSKMESEEYQKKLDVMNRQLQRNTIKFRDNRNAWSKQNYADSRVDETMELYEEMLPNIGKENFEIHEIPTVNGDTSLLVCVSDLHIGQTFKSYWGEYNSEIAKLEMQKYLNEVIKIGKLHNSNSIHIASIGDQVNGNIHSTIQITNKENVVDQVKIAVEIISTFAYELTKYFENVYFYDVSGNHSRLNPNKDSVLRDERLDNLISWTVCGLLKHIDNFHDMTHRKIDPTIAEANICGKNYLMIHGDMDSINKSGVGNLVTALGFCPEYIICGHNHTPAMNEFNGIRVYQSGSPVGSGDDYTVSKRLAGNPSQTVLVCNSSGVVCDYNVALRIKY